MGGRAVHRQQFRALAEAKLSDAIFLFEAGRWANAYYLAGYAVELALKACAARQFVAESIPDRKFVTSLHTHQLLELVGLAGLRAEFQAKQKDDSAFAANWGIIAEWSSEARYDTTDKSLASYLIKAIAHPDHGVLAWIRTFWCEKGRAWSTIWTIQR